MILDRIKGPEDVRRLTYKQTEILAEEIRRFLIETTSRTGGHLASNLGVVELTIAMYRVFNFPEDKVVWDVGHQSYTHKLLSGRKSGFDELRQYGGMSGFPKRRESEYDAFDTGHSSTSISAALGIAQARDLLGQDYKVISVIGDGALTGGMAYEALNNAGQRKTNFIIILNDNNMSISRNVGGMHTYLTELRADAGYHQLKKSVQERLERIPVVGNSMVDGIIKTKNSIKQLVIPGMLFENMGITYLGPVDGHDIRQMVRILKEAEKIDHTVLIHVLTKKGKGYDPAERHPEAFHGVNPFDIMTGQPLDQKKTVTYTGTFSEELCRLAAEDEKIVAVTAAMPDGTGLKRFSEEFPDRFFDVGIAEQHAVTSAAGMAAAGLKPVVAVYSSFLQRAFDQIMMDVCLQELPVVFCIDRAGLVGSDGESHQGLFDISFLGAVPGMTVLCPASFAELHNMLDYALHSVAGPVAVRYPRGGEGVYTDCIMRAESVIREGTDLSIVCYGTMINEALAAAEKLAVQGISAEIIKLGIVFPNDYELCLASLLKTKRLLAAEEVCGAGCIGQRILAACAEKEIHLKAVKLLNLGDGIIPHGTVQELRHDYGIDADEIVRSSAELCGRDLVVET